jgi:hypothetical protein
MDLALDCSLQPLLRPRYKGFRTMYMNLKWIYILEPKIIKKKHKKPKDIAYSMFMFSRLPKVFGICPLNLLKLRSLKNKLCSEKVLLNRIKGVKKSN